MDDINEYLQRNLKNKGLLNEFKTLKATLIYSYQAMCLYKNVVYHLGNPIMSFEDAEKISNELEEKY